MQSDLENSDKVAACGNEFGTLAICTEQCCCIDLCYELGTLAICTEQCCHMDECYELGASAVCPEQCCCLDVCYELYIEGWVFK
jgi:hypothetical protein